MTTKGKNKKVVLDASQIAQVEALASYFIIEQIARHFGFSEETFHRIKKRQPEVLTAYNRGRMNAETFAGDVVFSFMKLQEMTVSKLEAAKFYLTHQAGWVKAQFVPPKEEPQELKMSINILQAKASGVSR